MSTDPNEILRFILAQQQHGGGAKKSSYQRLHQLRHQLRPAPHALNTALPPSSLDSLSCLVTNYVQDAVGGTTSALDPVSNRAFHSLQHALAAQGTHHNQTIVTQINTNMPSQTGEASISQQQQELLMATKLLATINPGFSATAMEQALAIGVPSRYPQHVNAQQVLLEQLFSNILRKPQGFVTENLSANRLVNTNVNNDDAETVTRISSATKSSDFSTNNNQSYNMKMYNLVVRLLAQTNDNSRGVTSSTSSVDSSGRTSQKLPQEGSSNTISPQTKPLSLLTLQAWNIEQLESHVRNLQENNHPIPNTVRIALENARSKEEKKHAKKMANRMSAMTSRARKKQLVDELTAANAKLQRQALILSYLPDPVVVIGIGGEIKFCSDELERILKRKVDELLGSNIEDIIVPDSRGVLRRLIHKSLVKASIATRDAGEQQNQANGSVSGENGKHISDGSQQYSVEANTPSRSSDQSFPVLEVNFAGIDEVSVVKNSSNSLDRSSSTTKHNVLINTAQPAMFLLTHNSSSLTEETYSSEEKKGPPMKKKKTGYASKKVYTEELASYNEFYQSNSLSVNADDAIGSSVTANNGDSKLSSLMHYSRNPTTEQGGTINLLSAGPPWQPYFDRKRKLVSRNTSKSSDKQEDTTSLSAEFSTPMPSMRLNSSQESEYRDSNQSSDCSSISGSITQNTNRKNSPLAPACNVCLIRKDLTTIWCELTLSVHTRTLHDEENELGIIGLNPKIEINTPVEVSNKGEKDLMLCLRPIQNSSRKVRKELLL